MADTKDTQQMETQPETIKAKATTKQTKTGNKAKATDEVKTLKLLGVKLQKYKTAEQEYYNCLDGLKQPNNKGEAEKNTKETEGKKRADNTANKPRRINKKCIII